MQSASEMAVDANEKRLKRLKYVTENFDSLQGGLGTAGFGVLLLVLRADRLLDNGWLGLLTVVVPIVFLRAYGWLPGYYERRFGKVEQHEPQALQSKPMTPGQAFGCVGIVIALFVLMPFGGSLGRFLDSALAWINQYLQATFADGDPHVSFMPVLFWLFLFVVSTPLRRDHPIDWRKTSFFLCGTLFWIVIMMGPVHHPDLVKAIWWEGVGRFLAAHLADDASARTLFSSSWLAVTFIMMGLYDYLTLIFLLPKAPEVEQ